MTRRHLLLFGLPVALVALGVWGWMLLPRTAITPENAAKIKEGMTLAEVEAILGGPARDETTGPTVDTEDLVIPPGQRIFDQGIADDYGEDVGNERYWYADTVSLGVRFDLEKNVTGKSYWRTRRTKESQLDTVRRWLRL
jgi:hypothetical protein